MTNTTTTTIDEPNSRTSIFTLNGLRERPYYLIPGVLIALALLAFIGYFIVYNIYAAELFQFPFDYDQGEGF